MVDFKKLSLRLLPNGYRYFRELKQRSDFYTHEPTSFLVIDTETTGKNLFHGCRPFAVSAIDDKGEKHYWRFKVDPFTRNVLLGPNKLKQIKELISSYSFHVFHNGKFDVRALRTIGVNPTELVPNFWQGFRDTIYYSHAADSTEDHGLKALAKKYLNVPTTDEDALKEAVRKARRAGSKLGWKLGEKVEEDYFLAGNELDAYAMKDVVDRTLPLFRMYVEVIREEELGTQVAREHALTPIVMRMEDRGIYVRPATLKKEKARYEKLATENRNVATKIAVSSGMPKDFNPGSSKQLGELLYKKLKLPILNETANGNPSTDADTLEELIENKKGAVKAKRFLEPLLLSRKAEKALDALSQYESLLLKEGLLTILHGSLNQTGTRLTRFSSSDPNQQNISKDKELTWVEKGIRSLRCVFGPRPGHYWIDCDYDNIEMRLLAWASKETRLIEMFQRGESYHMLIAEILHGPKETWVNVLDGKYKDSPEYKTTKNGNFARGYGAGEAKVDATYGVPGAYQKLKNEFKAWADFNREKIKQAEEVGHIETLYGYRCTVPKNSAFTMALNSVIQGSAGDAMKYGMLAVAEDKEIAELGGEMILPVHDQLLVEFPNSSDPLRAANAVKRAMESPGVRLGIPLTVSPSIVRSDWTKAEDIETTFVSQF